MDNLPWIRALYLPYLFITLLFGGAIRHYSVGFWYHLIGVLLLDILWRRLYSAQNRLNVRFSIVCLSVRPWMENYHPFLLYTSIL